MANKDTTAKFDAVKRRFNYRQFFMIAVLLFATAADILIDYVHAGFDPSIFSDPSYWIMLGLTCLSVVLVTLSVRDFFREKELRENTEVTEVQKQIDNAHAELIRRDLTTKFGDYIADINAERKLKAYKAFIQFKITKAKKEKSRAKWKALLDKAEKDIGCIPTKGNTVKLSPIYHIRFNRVQIATIFSRVERTRTDDENMETNEQAHISELIFKKLFMVIAFSVALSTLFFEQNEFAVAVLINTFSKLFRTAMSVSLGASDGQAFVRGTLLTKMKLRLDFIQKFLEKEKAERATPAVANEQAGQTKNNTAEAVE